MLLAFKQIRIEEAYCAILYRHIYLISVAFTSAPPPAASP